MQAKSGDHEKLVLFRKGLEHHPLKVSDPAEINQDLLETLRSLGYLRLIYQIPRNVSSI